MVMLIRVSPFIIIFELNNHSIYIKLEHSIINNIKLKELVKTFKSQGKSNHCNTTKYNLYKIVYSIYMLKLFLLDGSYLGKYHGH
mgnify:CR=1 FL=1